MAVSVITLVLPKSSESTVALKFPFSVATFIVDKPLPGGPLTGTEVGLGVVDGFTVGLVVGFGDGKSVGEGEGDGDEDGVITGSEDGNEDGLRPTMFVLYTINPIAKIIDKIINIGMIANPRFFTYQ